MASPGMAQLLARDIPDALLLAPKERTAAHGPGAVAEHRQILGEALRSCRTEIRKRAGACEIEMASAPFTGTIEFALSIRGFDEGTARKARVVYAAAA